MARALAPTLKAVPSIEELKANPIIPLKRQGKGRVDLALDLSISCVGWAVGVDRALVRWGKAVFKTTSETGDKLLHFDHFLAFLIRLYKPDRILIERPSNKGKTRERHTELMGIVRKVWAEETGGEVLESWLISPKTIKNAMQVERGKDHKENKLKMVNKINQLFGTVLHLKFDPHSKHNSDDDTADAIAVMVTAWRRNTKK